MSKKQVSTTSYRPSPEDLQSKLETISQVVADVDQEDLIRALEECSFDEQAVIENYLDGKLQRWETTKKKTSKTQDSKNQKTTQSSQTRSREGGKRDQQGGQGPKKEGKEGGKPQNKQNSGFKSNRSENGSQGPRQGRSNSNRGGRGGHYNSRQRVVQTEQQEQLQSNNHISSEGTGEPSLPLTSDQNTTGVDGGAPQDLGNGIFTTPETNAEQLTQQPVVSQQSPSFPTQTSSHQNASQTGGYREHKPKNQPAKTSWKPKEQPSVSSPQTQVNLSNVVPLLNENIHSANNSQNQPSFGVISSPAKSEDNAVSSQKSHAQTPSQPQPSLVLPANLAALAQSEKSDLEEIKFGSPGQSTARQQEPAQAPQQQQTQQPPPQQQSQHRFGTSQGSETRKQQSPSGGFPLSTPNPNPSSNPSRKSTDPQLSTSVQPPRFKQQSHPTDLNLATPEGHQGIPTQQFFYPPGHFVYPYPQFPEDPNMRMPMFEQPYPHPGFPSREQGTDPKFPSGNQNPRQPFGKAPQGPGSQGVNNFGREEPNNFGQENPTAPGANPQTGGHQGPSNLPFPFTPMFPPFYQFPPYAQNSQFPYRYLRGPNPMAPFYPNSSQPFPGATYPPGNPEELQSHLPQQPVPPGDFKFVPSFYNTFPEQNNLQAPVNSANLKQPNSNQKNSFQVNEKQTDQENRS